ncbi:MAG: cytochrome c [Candidatus Rokubacteria bacterium]|nr:cytochrome c [Candidatus Rokubacteria bacterium]
MKGASRRLTVVIAGGALVIVGAWLVERLDDRPAPIEVRVPGLSAAAQAGQLAFDRSCAGCHGPQARGSATGPPLIHPTYRRAHHADIAFELAVLRGVRAHHWRFDDMPPQPSVAAAEIAQITRYVRELQAANGID